MKQKMVHLVEGDTGKYDDHVTWVARAFVTRRAAEAHRNRLNKMAFGLGIHTSCGERVCCSARDEKARRIREHRRGDEFAQADYTGLDYRVAAVPLGWPR